MADRTEQILTPSQLNTLARDLLEGSFPLVWVEAELGNVTRPASGHLYFTLKDARAQIRCAMFKPKSTWLKFQPREGLRVLARGRLTLYEARGDYQLVLDHMEEAGEGALRRAFEELRARLAAEGVFDAERKQPLPAHVRRLAVITSPSGAAVRDVLSVLARRFPLLEVDILPSLVQGDSAAAQITSLLQRADASGRYDVILITRGGGSLEDLWAFNDERLARAIAAAHTPVVSAVGHETDVSLSDFAADVRAPTPSVAAELLVPDQRELVARVRRAQARLSQLQQHTLGQAMQHADRLALRLRARSRRHACSCCNAARKTPRGICVRACSISWSGYRHVCSARRPVCSHTARSATWHPCSNACALHIRKRQCSGACNRITCICAAWCVRWKPSARWPRWHAAMPSSPARPMAAWCAVPPN